MTMLAKPDLIDLLPRSRDRKLVELWLHGASEETQRAYLGDVVQLLQFAAKPLHELSLGDLQDFRDALEEAGASPATVRRKLSSVKSALSFGFKTGGLPLNVGAALRMPAVRATLGERILSEADVFRMIERANVGRHAQRNRILVQTMYAGALRANEAAQLRKRDVQPHGSGGVLAIFGKGDRSRTVRISPRAFGDLVRILPDDVDARIFALSPRMIQRIVNTAAERAAIATAETPSPHWLRHAHASHALDRGCPIHLVQQTLGHRSVQTTGLYLHARPNESSALYLAV